jgi:hypothetical protein
MLSEQLADASPPADEVDFDNPIAFMDFKPERQARPSLPTSSCPWMRPAAKSLREAASACIAFESPEIPLVCMRPSKRSGLISPATAA